MAAQAMHTWFHFILLAVPENGLVAAYIADEFGHNAGQ